MFDKNIDLQSGIIKHKPLRICWSIFILFGIITLKCWMCEF